VTLRGRLAFGYAALLLVGLAALGGTLYVFLARSQLNDVDRNLSSRAQQLERASVVRGEGRFDLDSISSDIFVLNSETTGQELEAPSIYARVLDANGKVLAVSSDVAYQLPLAPERVQAAAAGSTSFQTVTVQGSRVRVMYWPFHVGGQVRAVIQVGESLTPMQRTLDRVRLILTVGGICIVLAGMTCGWLVARQALRPVRTLTDSVAEIARTGQFRQRVAQPETGDEIGRLAATFNELLDRLGVLVDRQRALVADTSHELRNPLMVVRGNLELMSHDELPSSERVEAVADSLEEVDRMSRLVSDLLFLADADTREAIHRSQVRLDEIVSSIAEDARLIASRDDGDREVILEANDPIVVHGDALRLRQLVWNLVENAIRYTPAGGSITLGLRRQGQIAELTVVDTGIGIPEEHQSHVFERFYRVDRGRSRALGGTGLGLSIVRQVALSHGGQVRVRSKVGEGSTFTVALPIAA